jgi:hypothetical protein
MSAYQEFAVDVQRRRQRLARQQMLQRMLGPVSTEALLWAALALIALGAFLGGILAAGLAPR